MKTRRLIFIAGFLIAVTALVCFVLISHSQRSNVFVILPKLAAATRSYFHDQVSHGRPLPLLLTVQDLVSGGYISETEVRDLAGTDVMCFPLACESKPHAILVSIRLPDGKEIATLADGSLKDLPR